MLKRLVGAVFLVWLNLGIALRILYRPIDTIFMGTVRDASNPTEVYRFPPRAGDWVFLFGILVLDCGVIYGCVKLRRPRRVCPGAGKTTRQAAMQAARRRRSSMECFD